MSYPRTSHHGRFRRTHIVRAERALARPLPPGAVVHHADGTRDPDAPLVICEDQGYHMLLHARGRVRQAGGNPDTQRICAGRRCRRLMPIARRGYCWSCHAAYVRRRRRRLMRDHRQPALAFE